jgi:hypothetical protein
MQVKVKKSDPDPGKIRRQVAKGFAAKPMDKKLGD